MTQSTRANVLTNSLLTAGVIVLSLIAIVPLYAHADTLTRQLEQGMSGSDVGTLQTFLAQDNTIYPQGLVTDFFGPLTFAAVSNFQSRNGIATVGRVGPITLAAINAQMSGSTAETTYAEGAGKPTNVGTSQPVVSNVAVTTTTNTATVTWTSNIPTTGKVWYSTNAAFNYNTAPSTSNANVTTAQNVVITGLQGATTYYYVVESSDAQGNFSWSQNGNSFKTQ